MTAGPSTTIPDTWDANAAAWTAVVRAGGIASRAAGTDAAVVAAVLALRPRSVLDVGCGEGWLGRRLRAEAGVAVTGVDGAAGLVAAAQAADPDGAYVHADYATLVGDAGVVAGPFDAVVLNFALLDNAPGPLLTALARRLAPGGALVIQTVHPWSACGDAPYVDGWRTEDFSAFGGAGWTPMPWFFRTLESWVTVLTKAGLMLTRLSEPVHPDTGRPLSLVLTAGHKRGCEVSTNVAGAA